jgi:intracellular sulfur oxidation DsrE/DsrF family protein
VFIAAAIRFLTDDPLPHTNFAEDQIVRGWRPELRARLRALHADHGVKLELCNVTRESVGLEESRLYAGVELVPVGEARLVELQERGYRYLKIE